MNEILQKRIEEAATFLFKQRGLDKESCRQAMDYILANQWISVEEALPEYKEPIIVKKGTEYAFASFQNGNFYIVGNIGKIDDVTHWMPIPSLEGGEK